MPATKQAFVVPFHLILLLLHEGPKCLSQRSRRHHGDHDFRCHCYNSENLHPSMPAAL
jgi:hypothetical protein